VTDRAGGSQNPSLTASGDGYSAVRPPYEGTVGKRLSVRYARANAKRQECGSLRPEER